MDPPAMLGPWQMQYRSKTCVLSPGRTSAGWQWAVDLDERTVKGGHAATEQAAIRAARAAIDEALGAGKGRLRVVGPTRDGRS
jgi:hypothetical protein